MLRGIRPETGEDRRSSTEPSGSSTWRTPSMRGKTGEKFVRNLNSGGAREGDQRKKDIFLGRDQMLPRLNSSTLEMRFSSSVSVIIILPSIESISSSSCRIRTYIR